VDLEPRIPPPRAPRDWSTPALGGTIAIAIALFVVVFALREGDTTAGDAEGILYALPIAVLALRFGLRGGLAGAATSFALIVVWDLGHAAAPVTVAGYLSRGIAFIVLGVLLGVVVDQRRRVQAELMRYYDVSLDLHATADLSGRFTHVNPAWESTLGHTAATLCSRPFIEFVHPEDRAGTIAETTALLDSSHETIRFRNRCRTADGRYRWLQWNAAGSRAEGVIHAVAHDITAEHEAEQQLADNATWLEAEVSARTRELVEARAETLQRLAVAAEYHDDETAQHTRRVGVNAAEIAARLGFDADQVNLVGEAAPLHDVGKLAIPDRILLKKGKLSTHEYHVMQTHAQLGARVLSGSNAPVLQMAAVIAASHHERWDGAGYPRGLAGEAIPLVGRVVAVADVYDALTHGRPYKPEWSTARAIAEIRREAGSQFDPRVVDAFLALHAQPIAITSAGAHVSV
jgi:PAS domain S-box-containing protein